MSTKIAKCRHCGNEHEFRCPIIKEIEYNQDGTEKKVVYLTPSDYVWPVVPASNPFPYQPSIPWYPWYTVTGGTSNG